MTYVSRVSFALVALMCMCSLVEGLSVVATLDLPSSTGEDLSQRGCVDSMQGKGYVVVSSDSTPFLYRFTLDPLSFKGEDKTFLVPKVEQSHGLLCDSLRGILYIYGRSAAVPGVGSFATIESVDIRNGTVLGELASYSTIATNEAGFLSAFVEPKKGHVFANCLEKQNTEKDEPELVHESGMTAVQGGGSTFAFAAVLCQDNDIGICTEDSSVSIIMATPGEEHTRLPEGKLDSIADKLQEADNASHRFSDLLEKAGNVAAATVSSSASVSATVTPSPTPSAQVSPSPALPTPSATPTGGSGEYYPLVATFRNFYPWPLSDFQLFGYTASTSLQFTTCANNTRPVTLLHTCEGDCLEDSTGFVSLEVLNQDLSVASEIFLSPSQAIPSYSALACVGRSTSAIVSIENVLFAVDLESGSVEALPLLQYEAVQWISSDITGDYAYAGVSTLNPASDSGVVLQISLIA